MLKGSIMASVIQSIAPQSESSSLEERASSSPVSLGDLGWLPDLQRLLLIQRAASDITQLAETLAYGSLLDSEGELSATVVQVLAKRVLDLGNSIFRCLDPSDLAELIAPQTFPANQLDGLQS